MRHRRSRLWWVIASVALASPALALAQVPGIPPPPESGDTPQAPTDAPSSPAKGPKGASRSGRPSIPMAMMVSGVLARSDEVDGRRGTGVLLDAGLLFRLRFLRIGATLGDIPATLGGATGLSYGVRAGVSLHPGGPLGVDAFADYGWQRYRLETVPGVGDVLATDTRTLPFVAGRLGLRWSLDRLGSWISASAFARTTRGTAESTYAFQTCTGPGACAISQGTSKLGGTSYGGVLAFGFDFDLFAEAPPPR